MTSSPPTVYAGIDWFSMSVAKPLQTKQVERMAYAIGMEQDRAGNPMTPWVMRGYRGMGSKNIRFGSKNGYGLLELSGKLADHYWREFLPYAHNVTRLDTCVDVTFSSKVVGLAEAAYAVEQRPLVPGLPACATELRKSANDGQTFYLGAPDSDTRSRLYYKSAQSPDEYPDCTWRYELQQRKGPAGVVASALSISNDVRRAISAHVYHHYHVHGIEPWFKADSISLFSPRGRARTGDDAFLDWLRSGVAPAISKRVERLGPAPILWALGLSVSQLT